jgi:hypothetical protein
MKPLIPVLFLSAAVPALCQSQHPYQFQVPPPQQSPHVWTQPRIFPFDKSLPAPGFTLHTPAPAFTNPNLDEHIIRRPPQGSFIPQPQRAPLAGNLYPDLRLLPLETARLDPIPVYFPRFKIEPIPTTWPDAKMVPLRTATIKTDQRK